MQTHSERREIKARLRTLAAQLDRAIQQAIEDPLVFADSPLRLAIESACAQLLSYQIRANDKREKAMPAEMRMIADLVWVIRARAGRLQRLLDSASRFYSTCFCSQQAWQQAEGLAYGMHGEWEGMASARHLSVDC